MSTRCIAIFLSLCALLRPATAAVVQWKNEADGQWQVGANWVGGQLPGENDDAVNPFVVAITHGMGDHTVNSFKMKGSLVLSGGSLTVKQNVLLDGGAFNIDGGKLSKATIDVLAGGGGGFVSLGNSGTLDGATILTSVRDRNGGTFTVTGGLTLRNPGQFAGTLFEFKTGSVLNFDGTQEMKSGSFLVGAATISQTPGTALTIRNTRFAMDEDMTQFTLGNVSSVPARPTALIFEGTNRFDRNNIVSEVQLNLSVAADRITNNGQLRIPGRPETIMFTAGSFTNSSSATFNQVNDFFTMQVDTFTNNGSYEDIGISTYKAKNVFNNGTFTVPSTGKVTFDQVAGAPRANTNNQLTVEKGGEISFLNGLRMTVGGAITVDGQLNIKENGVAVKGIQEKGTVSGKGTINGGWKVQAGFVKPGNSPGVLSINGDYEQQAGGELDIELGGRIFDQNTGLVQYSRLAVTGLAALDGGLSVSLVKGFVPSPADSFDILTADAGLSGFFSNASSMIYTDDGTGRFDVTYIPGSGSASDPGIVRLGNFTAVPEPHFVLLLALSALLRARRRG